MKFRSLPGQFHHEPPLVIRYDLYTELKPQVKGSHEFTNIYNTHNVLLIMDNW